jgi:ferredoxin-NADP reductase
MDFVVEVLDIFPVTHNVRCIRFQKPGGFQFVPGQATDVSINKPGWENEKRPFTFTCLAEKPYLEFTIKIYSDHNGVTNEIGKLKKGDSLLIGDAWGAIEYKGPGYFIAGGAGITPFISILRMLHKENKVSGNKLFFSNKTTADIIYKDELSEILGKENAVFVVTEEDGKKNYINEEFLMANVDDFRKHFYVCGPDVMVQQLTDTLLKKGASPDLVVFEK